MPELPEVEVVRAGLAPAVSGATILGVEVFEPRSLKRHDPLAGTFEALLTGRVMQTPARRGKFLWIPLEGTPRRAIVAHLGMSGQILLREPGMEEAGLLRIRLHIESPRHGELWVHFVDQRIFGSTPRILLASCVAYIVGEFVNSYVLARMKVAMRGRHLWMRTISSSLVGQGVDTLIFFPIAYGGEWPWPLVFQIMAAAYVIKVGVEVLLTPVTYAVVTFLKRRTGVDVYDYETDFNPFRIQFDD